VRSTAHSTLRFDSGTQWACEPARSPTPSSDVDRLRSAKSRPNGRSPRKPLMPLSTSTRVVNNDPGSVTVVVAETTGGGGNSATLDIYVMIDTNTAVFGNGHTPAGFRPNAPVDVVSWKNQTVNPGQTKEYTAAIAKPRASEASSTTVQCLVTGVYGGADYNETREAVIVWP